MTGFAANYATVSDEDVPAPTPDHIGDIMAEFDTPIDRANRISRRVTKTG